MKPTNKFFFKTAAVCFAKKPLIRRLSESNKNYKNKNKYTNL